MQSKTGISLFFLSLIVFGSATIEARAQAELLLEVALKSGESVEIGDLAWTINCRTFLKGMPEVEILDGPPGVTAAVKEKMVLPRGSQCAKRVPGALLSLKAADSIEDSSSVLRLRINILRSKAGAIAITASGSC
jgi:hypothetical protein